VPAYCAYGGLITSAPFFGEQPDAAELAESRRLLWLAAAVSVAAPLAGLLLSRWLRQRGFARLFTALLVIGLLGAAVLGYAATTL
jgi:MFS family permease